MFFLLYTKRSRFTRKRKKKEKKHYLYYLYVENNMEDKELVR